MAKKKTGESKPVVEKKKTGNDFGLNLKQSLFCETYVTCDEFFANGTQSYMASFNLKNPKVAAVMASRLLINDKILKYIDYLLEMGGLNDSFVDKQLQLVIAQNADMRSKVAGIKEYNALRSRIVKRLDHTTDGQKIAFVPNELFEKHELSANNQSS